MTRLQDDEGSLSRYTSVDALIHDNIELRQWWEQHKAEDEARRRKEQLQAGVEAVRERALAKLTPEEKAALGWNKQ